jgi:DNA-binding winged helix-turn-helix (wHTH) protein/Tol biopolymer transport system component
LIRFGVFEADLETGELRKRRVRIKLQEQPFQILAMLLERPGQVVTREELHKTLWGTHAFVDFERGLNKAINRLREALEDSAENPRFIETLPKRGYRFVAPLHATTSSPEEPVIVVNGDRRDATLRSRLFRSSLLPPPDKAFLPYGFTMSPDARRLAFVAVDNDGESALWIRDLSGVGTLRLSGTEGGTFPFWAPDNERIGFFADRKLKIIELGGGTVRALCDAPSGHGGAWNRNGTILFAPSVSGPLHRVHPSGGPASSATSARASVEQTHCFPSFLPDDHHFLFYVFRSADSDDIANGIYIGTLGSDQLRLLSTEIVGNVVYSSGHLLYIRDCTLVAQPFDVMRLELTGAFACITQQEIDRERVFSASGFTVSDAGVIVFQSTLDSATRLIWFDPSGKELGPVSQDAYRDPNFSPDGRFLAVSSDDAHNGKYSIRVFDLERGVSLRLSEPSDTGWPVWSSDGKQITYASTTDSVCNLVRVRADGSDSPQTLLRGRSMVPNCWSHDGHLVFLTTERGLPCLGIYSAQNQSIDPFGPGAEAQFSPDGQWIAYIGQGGVAGGGGIVVQRFPATGDRMPISGSGGAQPRWSHDGRQIFYVAPNRNLMAVSFDPANGRAGRPRTVFHTRIVAPNLSGFQYDVAPDGRFLVNSLPSNGPSPLTLITGWENGR